MYLCYENAVKALQSMPLRPTAAEWHSARRSAMLKAHPEVVKLVGDDPLTPLCMVAIVAAHVCVALSLESWGRAWGMGGGAAGFGLAFVAAAAFGGFCAFGFQALDHELSHTTSWPRGALVLGLVGSACTAVPWFSYYFSGGHARHHRLAGSPRDIDREAFFWAWERTPPALDNPLGSVVWASAVGIGLPVMYVASLSVCLLGNWRANVKELGFFAADSLATLLLHGAVAYGGGWRAATYLVLSMAFGNGFLMHPLIGFWLMQHLCHAQPVAPPPGEDGDEDEGRVTLQPTVSYTGSWVWNLLNFNQLSHTEHHDWSRISWSKAGALRALAPEAYGQSGLFAVTSVRALMWHWVFTKGDKMNFACIGAALPPLPVGKGSEKAKRE